MSSESNSKNDGGPWFFILVGVPHLLGAWWAYSWLTARELTGGAIVMPKIAILIYELLGKAGIVWLIGGFGAFYVTKGLWMLLKKK